MADDLDEYLQQQLGLSDEAAAAVAATLTALVLDAEDPDPEAWADLAASLTATYATAAALQSAGWLADWLAGGGAAVPVPQVDVQRDHDRLRAAYTEVGRLPLDRESRQFFAIRDRLMRQDGLDESNATRRAMDAVREQAAKRARKIAANETRQAGSHALSDAMGKSGRVAGWTRQTNGDTCRLCTDLANGDVLPPAARMIRHPNCNCTQRPVRA